MPDDILNSDARHPTVVSLSFHLIRRTTPPLLPFTPTTGRPSTVYSVLLSPDSLYFHEDKPSMDSGNKSRITTKRSSDGQSKNNLKLYDENCEEDEDKHGETLCGSCGGNYSGDRTSLIYDGTTSSYDRTTKIYDGTIYLC
ncbi:hypothetical protein ACSBR1_040875 [Camellia fascicularis]